MSYDTFAHTIADIAADLPAGHVAAWSSVLTAADEPSSALEAALIDSRPGYAVAGHARRLLEAWRAAPADLPGSAVARAMLETCGWVLGGVPSQGIR